MSIAGTIGNKTGDGSPGDAPGRLHDHLEVIAIGVAPHDLAYVVAGQGTKDLMLALNGTQWHSAGLSNRGAM